MLKKIGANVDASMGGGNFLMRVLNLGLDLHSCISHSFGFVEDRSMCHWFRVFLRCFEFVSVSFFIH